MRSRYPVAVHLFFIHNFFLKVREWNGTIINHEPQKCDELDWYPLTAFPENIIPYVRQGLMNYLNNIHFSEFGWE